MGSVINKNIECWLEEAREQAAADTETLNKNISWVLRHKNKNSEEALACLPTQYFDAINMHWDRLNSAGAWTVESSGASRNDVVALMTVWTAQREVYGETIADKAFECYKRAEDTLHETLPEREETMTSPHRRAAKDLLAWLRQPTSTRKTPEEVEEETISFVEAALADAEKRGEVMGLRATWRRGWDPDPDNPDDW